MFYLQQYPILIPFIAILLAEFTKAFVDIVTKRHKIRFIKSGGMPSGHSAFVAALVVVVVNRHGVESVEFMISAVLAVIVMYDAVNLRFQVGEHAKAINRLKKGLKLEESVGHTRSEVVAGAIFGALVAFLLLLLMT